MEIKNKSGKVILTTTFANLLGADLRDADLRGADLGDADLDFSSGLSFSCRGTNIVGGDRLFAQLVYHLTRQDWSSLSVEKQEWLQSIPEDIKNAFCKFRNELSKI